MWALLHVVCLGFRNSTRVAREDLGKVLAAGFVSLGVYMVFFLEGMQNTSAAEGAVLLATAPLLTYVFSVAGKLETFSLGGLFGTLLAFAGVSAVILGGARAGSGTLVGNLTVFTSAVIWALSTLQMRPLLTRYEPLPLLTASVPGALPLLIPYGALATSQTRWAELTTTTWANLVQITFGSGLIAFVCFYMGVKSVGPAIATRYQFFVPVIAAGISWIVFGRSLVGIQWLGIAGVIGGVAVTSFARFRDQKPSGSS
jgi:drug/metabolite transporter (DMT)-like permease